MMLLLVCSCRSNGQEQRNNSVEETVFGALPDNGRELSLPEVPSTLTAPEERTAYILEHFWDGMDFRDTLRGRDSGFVEQNLVNFLSLFPHAHREALPSSVGRLLKQAATDSVALHLVGNLTERYLNDPNSPMRNEEYYILFLEAALRQSGWSERDRVHFAYQLKMAGKNRPGTLATDFAYLSREGKRATLHKTSGKRLLLLFYDPECGHCSAILQQLHESDLLRSLTAEGELTVLAVYTEGNREAWDATKASMPQEWRVGMDMDGILEHELYDLPAMPIIYLLDQDKRVLLKDPTPEYLETFLSSVDRADDADLI